MCISQFVQNLWKPIRLFEGRSQDSKSGPVVGIILSDKISKEGGERLVRSMFRSYCKMSYF